jgi:hypothetical protein
MREPTIISLRFAVFRLLLFAEMRSTRLFPMQRIVTEQFGEFEKIGHSPRILQFLVEGFS